MTDEDEMVLREAGLDVRDMRFLDSKTGGVDWEGLREDLQVCSGWISGAGRS
jgi:aspartate aminotransferase